MPRAGLDPTAVVAAGAFRAFRAFVLEHPGRYAATIGVEPSDPDDPLATAGRRLLAAFMAVLRGYAIAESDVDHALRMLRSLCHGFATLQAADGFQRSADVDESFEWLTAFADRGLRAR
ncbi:WHG domain-containing protein [Streptomyces reniochalinae]|uniref:WHG domain-containing protein n=1 Tax=Streptomyces reniochalinae TaxID=2250578 RepID=A0A367EEZ2_9ACTN|nr:WHG domain-containing protein [Streptomyces reniochalinae]